MTSLLETPVATRTARLRRVRARSVDSTPDSPWLGFAAILAASILNILDSTLVNVAGPSIRTDLAMSTATLEWVAAAYTLALGVGLMTGARLGDMIGRRRLWLAGVAGFVVASLMCSLAGTAAVLIGARVLQGIAAALALPQGFGLIRDLFPGDRMGKAFGAMGPVIGMATVLGPITAGYLINADLFGSGWRSLFWINLPLGLFALLTGWLRLPAGAPVRNGLCLDVPGAALLTVASFLLVFPLVDGRGLGWPLWIFGLLALALPAFAAFLAQQRARLLAGRHPLVEVTVLRKRSYLSGAVFVLAFFAALIGFQLVVGLFLQIGLGLNPMHASHYLAALAVGAFVGAWVGAWGAQAVGRPILHIGLTVMAIAVTLLLISVRTDHGAVGGWQLGPALALFGVGMGQIFVPLFSIVMGDVDDHEVGSASDLLTALEQLGASLGVAVLGTVFFGDLRLEDGGPAAATATGRHLTALQHTLGWVLAIIAVTWLLGWLLPRRPRTATH
jgi:EmrB/QacA subfamily drug resistance transporter